MLRIVATIIPRAGKNSVEKIGENEYRVRVTAIPEKGQANQRLIRLLAKHLSVAPSLMTIVAGSRGRKKIIEIL
jgi:hypothetical protein